MIDLNVLRDNTDQVKKSLKNRGFELDVDFFHQLEHQRKDIQIKTQDIQQERNSLSKQIGILKAKGEDTEKIMQQVASISSRTKDYEIQLQDIQQQLNDFLLNIPNLPHKSVPIGPDEKSNLLLKKIGDIPKFNFDVKDHVDLGNSLGLDFETAIKISGSRFVFMKHDIARLHRAIGQFMIDTHVEKHNYMECYTPFLVNSESLLGTGQLPKFGQDLFLTKKLITKIYTSYQPQSYL